MTSPSELAPQEDQGKVLAQTIGPPNATLEQMQSYQEQMFDAAHRLPEYDATFQIIGQPSVNQGFGGVLLKPWEQRKPLGRPSCSRYLQDKWNHIAGAHVAAFQFPLAAGLAGPAAAVRHHHDGARGEPV